VRYDEGPVYVKQVKNSNATTGGCASLFILCEFALFTMKSCFSPTSTNVDSSTASDSTSSQVFDIGAIGYLSSGSSDVYLAYSKDDFDAMASSLSSSDQTGFQNLVSSGAVYSVAPHTQAKLLGIDLPDIYHVRIIGGEHDGADGWTEGENLQKQ
jgi:hypothetical protein